MQAIKLNITTNIELINTIFILNVKKSKSNTICDGARTFRDSINTSYAKSIKKKYPKVFAGLLIRYKYPNKIDRLYTIWKGMKYRCYNSNSKSYNDYGGRGLELDDRWNPDLHLRGVARFGGFYCGRAGCGL